jgi:uncharacterized membrane protein YfcA
VSWVVVASLVLGFGSGVLAGMFGIGGAVITTPSIRALGATPIHAVGSTVPAILPGSISGAYRYAKAGSVDWRVGLTCGTCGALFAIGGAAATRVVDAHYLMILTAGLLAFTGVSQIRSTRAIDASLESPAPVVVPTGPERPVDGPAAPSPSLGLLVAVGAGAGGLAGLLGVGGGIVMMPAFTGLLKLPMRLAVGSSLVAVAIFSVPALVTHAWLGNIDWRFALPLAIGVVPGAQVGARLTLGTSERLIRRFFGVFLLAISVVYAVSEILALH